MGRERSLVAVHGPVPTARCTDVRQVSDPPRGIQHGIVVLGPPEDARCNDDTNGEHEGHDLYGILLLVAREAHLVVKIRMVAGCAARRADLKERPIHEAQEVGDRASLEAVANGIGKAREEVSPLQNRAHI